MSSGPMLRFRKLEYWHPKGRRLRVVIYARYSSDLQSPRSIEDQVRDCQDPHGADGWELVGVYSDRDDQRRHGHAPRLPSPV